MASRCSECGRSQNPPLPPFFTWSVGCTGLAGQMVGCFDCKATWRPFAEVCFGVDPCVAYERLGVSFLVYSGTFRGLASSVQPPSRQVRVQVNFHGFGRNSVVG